jgi:hypothetical protein
MPALRGASGESCVQLRGDRVFCGSGPGGDTVKLDVDLTDAPRHIIHSTMTFQAHAGQMTLRYPKWLPGEHGPTGPIKNVAGIFVKANGKDIGWTREPKDMYAFRVDVPAGAGEIVASLDLLDPAQFEGSHPGIDHGKARDLELEPGRPVSRRVREDQIDYERTLTLPGGWTFGTALPVAESRSSKVSFKPVSLHDTRRLAGARGRVHAHRRPRRSPRQKSGIDMAADARADLAVPPELEKAYVKLVKEADACSAAGTTASITFC